MERNRDYEIAMVVGNLRRLNDFPDIKDKFGLDIDNLTVAMHNHFFTNKIKKEERDE